MSRSQGQHLLSKEEILHPSWTGAHNRCSFMWLPFTNTWDILFLQQDLTTSNSLAACQLQHAFMKRAVTTRIPMWMHHLYWGYFYEDNSKTKNMLACHFGFFLTTLCKQTMMKYIFCRHGSKYPWFAEKYNANSFFFFLTLMYVKIRTPCMGEKKTCIYD